MNILLKPIRLFYRAIRRLHVMDVTRLMHLADIRCPHAACPDGYEIRAVQSGELKAMLESQRAPEQIGIPGPLEDGCHAVIVALRADRVVSFSWFAKQTVDGAENVSRATHLGTSIDLPDGTVFVYNAWTDPAHRGQRLVASILGYALRHRILGALSLLTSIDWTNQKSMRAFKFVGMESLGIVVRIGRGRLQISLIPNGVRRVGVRVAGDAPGYKVAF